MTKDLLRSETTRRQLLTMAAIGGAGLFTVAGAPGAAAADGTPGTNGKPLRLPDRTLLADARVIGNASALKTLSAAAPVTTVPGGDVPLSLRLAFTAEAKVDAALSTNPKHDWDLAAGDLLVHETGGRVTGIDGRMFIYNRRETQQSSYVAAPSGLHAEILKRLGA